MTDIVREWYETKAHVDEMRTWTQGMLKRWEQDVAVCFPRGARVLDVGCGMGREAYALSDMGFSVTGIDISHEVIRKVTAQSLQQGRDIPFLAYDGKTLPFADAAFDVVIIWAQTFGLLYGDAYKRDFLRECRRVLVAGGLLSFSGHDVAYVRAHHAQYLDGRKFYPYADTRLYWETFLPDELKGYAQCAGFTVTRCEQGEIYTPEDGTILHCLCEKNAEEDE